MFSEEPLTSVALVLAILAYLGAVRIAIRQRLGEVLRDMKSEKRGSDKWYDLRKSACNKHKELRLLVPADITFVGVAIMLVLTRFCGSLAMAIDGGIMFGTAWLVGLHVAQWWYGRKAAIEPPPSADSTDQQQNTANNVPCCTNGKYWRTIAIGVVVLLVLVLVSIYDKQLPGEHAEAHYKLGCELYEKDRFDVAIVQHQHAVRINECIARYHYALAKAVARKAEYSLLKSLKQAIEIEKQFRDKAKTEQAFDSIRDDQDFRKLVNDP